ncbi:MAG: hypothetical protein JNM43_21160 [Planctomycetaceae bacterium]|nr:hypothetical protein [Planctomycetaceae bacterium]
MSFATMSRGSRTLLVGIGLMSVYAGYAALTRPWLTVDHKPSLTIPRKAGKTPEKSRIFETAAEHFEADSWVKKANGKFRDGERLLFFDKHELFNDNRSIRVKPVALLWGNKSEDDEDPSNDKAPITATADSAQLDASTKFSLGEGQFGKITSGLLAGDVRISGPELSLEGRTFYIDEDAMKIWTGQPVKFQWQGHNGHAEGGAEIELVSSSDPEQAGLMSVSNVSRIRLLGRVTCNLYFVGKQGNREAVMLNVNAANGFEYFVPTRQGTFSGFVDRELKVDNQVLVERLREDESVDKLFCSQLVLGLQPKIRENVDSDEGKKKRENLELASITADGRRVIYHSELDDIRATMSILRFQLFDQTLEMLGRPEAATGKPIYVDIRQGSRHLVSPQVFVSFLERRGVRSIECSGPGRIEPVEGEVPDQKIPPVTATWNTSLVLDRGEEDRITLTGTASVSYPEQDMGLDAETIEIVLEDEDAKDQPAVEHVDGAPTEGALTDGAPEEGVAGKQSWVSMDSMHFRAREVIARQDVLMTVTGLTGKAREKLVVKFANLEEGALSVQPVSMSRDSETTQSTADGSSGKSDTKRAPLKGLTEFSSDTIEASLLMVPDRDPQLQDIWLKGGVSVVHTSEENPAAASFKANGNVLHAEGGFVGDREINLFGDPASVVRETARIEGKRIDLTEIATSGPEQAEAKVEGSGRIRFIVERGPNGQPLASPAPLDIYWTERMTFSGRTAHFIGNVRAVLNNEVDYDAELTCAGMKVHFAEDVQIARDQKEREKAFNDPRTKPRASKKAESGAENDIVKIECEGQVIVDAETMLNGVVTARHHAEFADFVIDQVTGDFNAMGPGVIESVQPDKNKRLKFTGRTVAKANTPINTPDHACMYMRATFIGAIEGNHVQRFVRLRQHVRGVFGPVRTLDDKINIDGLGADELPSNTGSMGCENLTVSMNTPEGSAENSFSLVAESNGAGGISGTRAPCRLESKEFSGDADKITYDHSKQQYILRADEGRQAKVTYQPNGREPQTLTGRRFDYYADRNQLQADQITGVQGTGDL